MNGQPVLEIKPLQVKDYSSEDQVVIVDPPREQISNNLPPLIRINSISKDEKTN
jgi:hypothetical protein